MFIAVHEKLQPALSPARPAAHPSSPVQRALDESPRVTAQRAVAARLAQRRQGVAQRVGNGLAEPEAMAKYALPLAESLQKAAPANRVALLRDAINATLAAAGVPPVAIKMLDHGGSAEFDEKTWTMGVLKESVESADPGILAELVGTVYHEARHAEQFFRVAQQAAAASDDTGFYRLNLPRAVREAAVQSKAEFATLGEPTRKATTEWAESLQNPRAVIDPMEAAGKAMADQFELYSKSLQVLLVSVRMLSLQAGAGDLSAVGETADILTNHREEETGLTRAAKLYKAYLVAYRQLPHEADAHGLGWQVEDTFRTGKAQATYNPKHASRVPDDDPIWADIAAIDRTLDQLRDLLDALKKLAASSSAKAVGGDGDSDEDEAFDFEPTVEERAREIAKRLVSAKPQLSEQAEYLKVLEQLKKTDQEKALAAADLSPLSAAEKLGVLAGALGQWAAVEPKYLQALSAKLHRRTNF